jgi:flagella basal body P-ring formation protein FlgA
MKVMRASRPLQCLLLLLLLSPATLPGLANAQTARPALQDPAALVAQAEALLKEQAAAWPGRAVIHVDAPRIVNQAACQQMEASLSSSGLQPRTPVTIRCLAPQPWTIYLQASVQIQGTYYVANRLIQRDQTLSLNDLDTREGDLLRNRRLIGDPAHIVGWIATRRIRAGSAIESNALRDPNAIERGQQVRTVARGVGFVATSEGQALESGSPGARIQVRTPGGQIITGTVIDAHTVQVMM